MKSETVPVGKYKSKLEREAAAYDKWLKTEIQEAIDDPSPTMSHDQVVRNVYAAIKEIKKE